MNLVFFGSISHSGKYSFKLMTERQKKRCLKTYSFGHLKRLLRGAG